MHQFKTAMKKILGQLAFFAICFLILLLTIKGKSGQPLAYQFDQDTSVGGPFESSNNTSRYVLTQAIALNHRFTLTEQEARLAAPDVVYYDNRFQSIFMPGISLMAVPFFLIGNYFQAPQLGAYFSTIVFSLINVYLVYKLSCRLGAHPTAAKIGACVFLFGTNAFVYALTLTQHQASITVLLAACLLAFQRFSWKSAFFFGALYGLGFLFDFPNLMILFPLGVYMLTKAFIFRKTKDKILFSIKLQVIALLIGFLPLLALFGWYNIQVTGSPVKIAQFLGRSNYFDTQEKQESDAKAHAEDLADPYSPHLPFQTRLQLKGLTVLTLGNERSWLYYSPVLLLGIAGIISLLKDEKKKTMGLVVMSVVVTNIFIYSLFGDPWGGWSFGARYLLQAAALMSVFLAVALTTTRSWIFKGLFIILTIYSVCVSAAGAVTSATIPPKQESIHLTTSTPYTYEYNFRLINEGKVFSLAYSLIDHSKVSAFNYYVFISTLPLLVILTLFIMYSVPSLPSLKYVRKK